MATSEATGLDLFITMATIWQKRVPPTLVDESPSTLTQILELSSAATGMSHSAMQQRLGLSQPEMSNIAKKLVTAGWIRSTRLEANRRVKLITATAAGRSLLSTLKTDLNAAKNPADASSGRPKERSRRLSRGKVRQQGGQIPFDLESCLPPDEDT